MAEMMDLYNEAENSVLGTLIADAEVNASLVFTRVRPEDFVTGHLAADFRDLPGDVRPRRCDRPADRQGGLRL